MVQENLDVWDLFRLHYGVREIGEDPEGVYISVVSGGSVARPNRVAKYVSEQRVSGLANAVAVTEADVLRVAHTWLRVSTYFTERGGIKAADDADELGARVVYFHKASSGDFISDIATDTNATPEEVNYLVEDALWHQEHRC